MPTRFRGALVAAAAALTFATAVMATTSAAATTATVRRAVTQNPRGQFLGVIPSQPSGAPAATPHAAVPHVMSQVTYHNGPVQHSSAVQPIFWAPPAVPFPSNYAATIVKYFTDVAHDSFTAGNPYGSDTQYYDIVNSVKRWESYAVTLKPTITDTNAYPANGCNNYMLDDSTMSKKCLTNAQIVNQIKAVITAHSLPTGMATNYFLFTPQGIASCLTASSLSSGGCYDPLNFPGYCAYHSHAGTGAQVVLFANVHFANINGCASGQSPQGNSADSTINEVSHEHQETITDPLGTAWFDTDGNEIADKCVFTFGAPLGTNSFGQYNEAINNHGYWLQEIWSNRDQDCVQRNTWPQPTSSFTFSPTAPARGAKVSFHSTSHSGDGSALTYRWTFPGGTVSTMANPSTSFSTAGSKVVTLVVADTHGDQARVTHTVTVH